MGKTEDLRDLMKGYDDLLAELIAIENEKVITVAGNKIEDLDRCLKKEEAGMLKIRGIDARREKLTAELGYSGMTFREILNKVAAVHRDELQPLFNAISEKAAILRTSSESARRMIESRMIMTGRRIAELQKKDSSAVYDRNGERVDGPTPHISSRSV